MFYFDTINSKKVLKSTLLKGLEHFFTTKESFIKTKEADCLEIIEKNKRDICNYLNINPDNLICPEQTHSANIETAKIGIQTYKDTDALILDNSVQALYLSFADCTPVILYDSKNNIAALVHAGWRGTAQMIAPKTIDRMKNLYDSKPSDIKAAIGPAICYRCFETSDEAIMLLSKTITCPNKYIRGRYADLKGINACQLEESGVKQIDICSYCTVCDNEYFFSYRKENKTTSRHSAVIKLSADNLIH